MLFSSLTFLFVFLPIVIIAYLAAPKAAKNVILLIASLIFYAWGEPVYVVLMILSILFNYVCGLDIESRESFRGKKRTLVLAVAVNLALLGFYKYSGFIVEIINPLFGGKLSVQSLPLPIGISFYTFQAISYIVDVYRGNAKAQRNIINFALYITMFFQLIAGPIVKYTDIEKQLNDRHISLAGFGAGAKQFIYGLAKKVILADGIGAIYTSASPIVLAGNADVLTAWVGALAFMFQIYFDFSGYSDMAIGLGRMFGFRIKKNFNQPYCAVSVTDFWRRWHISLSSWFREYVYIPLGGNRVSVERHALNLMIVWMLTGLWHGAAWNFVAWGLYYGILLIAEKYIWGDVLEKLPNIFRRIYTLIIVLFGWVLFAADGLKDALLYIRSMLGMNQFREITAYGFNYIRSNWLLFVLCILFSSAIPYVSEMSLSSGRRSRAVLLVLDIMLFVFTVCCLLAGTFHPFLYFRF